MRDIVFRLNAAVTTWTGESKTSYRKTLLPLASHCACVARGTNAWPFRNRPAVPSYIGQLPPTTSAASCIAMMRDMNDNAIELLALSAGELRATIAPACGGSLASFTRAWKEGTKRRELHWLRPANAQALATNNPLEMASFPLVPFCNRIRDGRARFEGRDIRFPPNHPGEDSPHPLHGIGWLSRWKVESCTARDATLSLDVPASAAWPWHFSAREHYTLTNEALHIELTVRNEDTAAMPAGLGHHPYFPHHPGTRITSAVDAIWETDPEVMPVALERTKVCEQLTQGVELSQLSLDNNFTGWRHRTVIEWPEDVNGPARSLLMQADSPLDFFVLYCPRGYDYFCAEPVSQCTDWLNMLDRYAHDALGGSRVEPRQGLTVRFTLRPNP